MVGAVAATGYNLVKGGLTQDFVPAAAEFNNCGQGLREGGDVKLRGVLVGRIGGIERVVGSDCRVSLNLFPPTVTQIPANVGAQIRAKTIFGEKWVELQYPQDPTEERLHAGDEIPVERTIDPLEVETILNSALPILEAIDPEHLAGALTALAEGFAGHEDAAIRGIESGIEALKVVNQNQGLVKEGIRQLAESGEVLAEIDEPLLESLRNLDRLNRFTTANQALIRENLDKAPVMLGELSTLFDVRFADLTQMVNSGATIISVLAAHSGDIDRLLDELPKFNAAWIRNLGHVCRYRQPTTEPGKSEGDQVPGRCWRVHNIFSETRGPYEPGEEPRPKAATDYDTLGEKRPSPLMRLLDKDSLLELRSNLR